MSMSFNVNKTPIGLDPAGGHGRIKDSTIYIGIVKQNNDAQFMGRIAVWIPEIGGNPNDPQNWIVVSYASPFAGVTPSSQLVEDSKDASGSQSSYGFWMNPPDLDNQVLVCFANGNFAMGFWFACVWQQNMNNMVPGIPVGVSTEDPATMKRAGSLPPVVEYNKWSKENPNSPHRPIFQPLTDGLSSQGLFTDPERGPSTTSARREAPSKVFGYLTPRGNTIHVDDNPTNEFIRMRTRSGAQVLVHETTGYVYINSKNGNSWAEISDKGVDIYSRGSVSLRSEGSLNLKADGSLNIEADGNLNLRAGGNLTIQSAHHTNFAGNGDLVLDFGGTASTKAGAAILLDTGGSLKMGAGGSISQASGGQNIRSASAIYDNSSPSAPAPGAPTAVVEQPRTLPDVNGSGPEYSVDSRQTIVRRMPTHEPYVMHPKGGSGGLANASNQPDLLSSTEFASAKDANAVAATGNSSVAPSEPAQDLQNVTDDDLTWMTVCLLTEAGGLGDDMQAAVAQVVLNRVSTNFSSNKRNDSWSGIKKYVLAYAAFSYFWSSNGRGLDVGPPTRSGTPSRIQVTPGLFSAGEQRGLAKIKASQGSAEWNKCKSVAQQVIAGTYTSSAVDPIKANKRCTMYVNLATVKPSWATSDKLVTTVGHPNLAHTFYLS